MSVLQLVPAISTETVSGILPNLDTSLGQAKELIRF